jgi:hypothetical protein
MSYYATGLSGSLSVDSIELFKIREWRLNASAEALPTTKLDDNAPTYRYGRQSYSGSCTAYYYLNDFYGAKTLEAQSLLQDILRTNAIPTNNSVELKLTVCEGKSFTCTALITSAELGATAGAVTTMSLGFQVTGNLVEVSGAS